MVYQHLPTGWQHKNYKDWRAIQEALEREFLCLEKGRSVTYNTTLWMPLGRKHHQYYFLNFFFYLAQMLAKAAQPFFHNGKNVPSIYKHPLLHPNLGNDKKDINITIPAGRIKLRRKKKIYPSCISVLPFSTFLKRTHWKKHLCSSWKCRFLQQSWLWQ